MESRGLPRLRPKDDKSLLVHGVLSALQGRSQGALPDAAQLLLGDPVDGKDWDR